MAPRIPVTPQVQTRPLGSPRVDVNTRGTHGEQLGAALGSVGRDVGDVGQVVGAMYERERQKAIVVDVTDADTELRRRLTGEKVGFGPDDQMKMGLDLTDPEAVPMPNGYLRLRGRDAAKASEQALRRAEKHRAEVESALSTPEAKEVFRQRSQVMLDSFRGDVMTHAGAEIARAQVDSLEASKAGALKSISIARDRETVDMELRSVEAPIRALQTSPEDGERRIAAFRAQAAALVLDGLLAGPEPKLDQARKMLDGTLFSRGESPTVREVLDPKAVDHYEKVIKGEVLRIEAERITSQMLPALLKRSETGRLDEAEADDIINKHVPDTEPARRKALRAAVHDGIRQHNASFDAETKDIARQAHAIYNAMGWSKVPSALKEELNRRDPPYYERLQNAATARWERSKKGDAEARREQAEIDRMALYDFQGRPIDERSTLDPTHEYAPAGVSEVGLKRIAAEQRKVKEGMTAGETDFVKTATSRVQGMLGPKNKDKPAFEAQARRAYDAWVQANGGKRPTRDDEEAIIGTLLDKQVKKKSLLGIDALWPDSEEPAWKARARDQKNGNEAAPVSGEDAPVAAPAVAKPKAKVVIVSKSGQRASMPADTVDAWLAEHPKWRRE